MPLTLEDLDRIDFEKSGGLVPAVVQNADTGRVLMLGYMNREALETTIGTKFVTFYSRSKKRLWMKGEASGNILNLVSVEEDCDADALLVLARPEGPTCHLGTESCFDETEPSGNFLWDLEKLVVSRKTADPESSYTAHLFRRGVKRCAQKVGEEGVETALAAVAGDREELVNESSDLVYHLLVLLAASNVSIFDVVKNLEKRHSERTAKK